MRKVILATAAAWLSLSGAADAASPIEIGTGDEAGVYHVIGRAICAHVDRSVADCDAKPSAGSIENIERLRSGEIDFALVQADLQFAAATGLPPFKDAGKFENLASIAAFHSEAFTIMAPQQTGIRRFADLEGKRVNADEPGSGTRRTFEFLLNWREWKQGDLATIAEYPPSAMEKALCEGRVDAAVYVVGHPNRAVRDAVDDCPIRFVSFGREDIATLITAFPYFTEATIPAGTYPAVAEDVATFGVPATLVTRADVADTRVRAVLDSIYDNLEAMREGHAALSSLDRNQMDSDGLYAPLHPAAKAFYDSRGK